MILIDMETANKTYLLNTDICEYIDDERIKEWINDEYEETPENLSEDQKFEIACGLRDDDIECFWDDLKRSDFNTYCIVTGTLGLWWGQPDIKPTFYTTLEEALKECIGHADDSSVYIQNGVIYAEGRHHDGTNRFEIRVLKDDWVDRVDEWCTYETGKFPFDLDEINKPIGYLW